MDFGNIIAFIGVAAFLIRLVYRLIVVVVGIGITAKDKIVGKSVDEESIIMEEQENRDIDMEDGTLFCPNCGKKLPADSIFCQSCGANITKI